MTTDMLDSFTPKFKGLDMLTHTLSKVRIFYKYVRRCKRIRCVCLEHISPQDLYSSGEILAVLIGCM
jgi:hypothetical protein